MAVYVYNGPVIMPYGGGSKNVCFTVDGGKRISQWSNIRNSGTWLSVGFDETQYEDGIQYQYFNATATKSTQTSERYTIVYADYTAEDGTTGTINFTVYQEAAGGVSSDTNPLFFGAGDYQRENSQKIHYAGTTIGADINTPTWSSSYFNVIATAGGYENNGYSIEYDIYPKQYNTTDEDITGYATFSYINPTTSVKNEYTLRLNQQRCLFPFGIYRLDGGEILLEGMGMNKIRRIRGIDFRGQTLSLGCYFPYYKSGTLKATLDWDYDWVSLRVGGGEIDDNIGDEQYTLYIAESFQTGVRSFKINVEYETLDGQFRSDSVQVIQNASDGSNIEPQVNTGVGTMKVKYDGTPDMASNANLRVQWIGDYTQKDVYADANWIAIGEPVLKEQNGAYSITYEYPLTFSKNETKEPRSGKIYCDGVLSDTTAMLSIVEVTQARNPMEDIDIPDIPVEGDEYIGAIWEDVEYDFGWNENVEYSIYKGDTPIFFSRTSLRPNTYNNKILVNKICQNYMETPLLTSDTGGSAQGYDEFKLCSLNGDSVYKTYKFINDWSYSKDFKTGNLSHPILNDNTNVYYGQWLPFSIFAAADRITTKYGIRYKEGYTDEYGKPMEDWIQTMYSQNTLNTVCFPYSQINYKDGVIGYMIDGVEYKLVDNCKVDYVLYYVNPWGGYDWFPIRGKVVENDDITQYTYTKNYINTKLDFGKSRYLSEIRKKFQLNTHWLREEESLRMWYLLQSNVVYLHNIKTNDVYPVIITNSTQEHKKRGLISNRISYQIEVELSQTRERL